MGIARKHLDFQPLAGAAKMPTRVPRIRGSAWLAESPFLAGMQIGMQGFDLLLFGSYHRGGLDLTVLTDVARATHDGQLPFVLFGDFNDTPEEIEKLGWLARMNACVIHPGQGTCTNFRAADSRGDGRCIDYVIISKKLRRIVHALHVSWQVPFAPHAALTLHLSRDPRLLLETKAKKPSPIPKDFPKLIENIPAEELELIWNSITAKQASDALVSAGYPPLSTPWSNEHTSTEEQLREWGAKYGLWLLHITGKDPTDQAIAKKAIGRAQLARYVRVVDLPVRRASVTGVNIKVPCSNNA